MSDLNNITSNFYKKISSVKSKEDLQILKTEFFGKSGEVTSKFKSLGTLSEDKRKEFASSLNKLKDELTNELEKKFIEFEKIEINEKLKVKK